MVEKLTQTYALAARLMDEHGLVSQGWKFNFSTSKHRVAVCKHDEKLIEYSMHYITKSPIDDIRDTILHEIAHALVGPGHGHDIVWRHKCVEIGARPERLAGENTQSTAKPNYVLQCPDCNTRWTRHRLKKAAFNFLCPYCNVKIKVYKVVK